MNRSWENVRQALPLTLLIQLVFTGASAVCAAALGPALEAPPTGNGHSLAQLLENARLQPALWTSSRSVALTVGVLLLLSQPGLHLAWLHALGRRAPVAASVAFGVTHWWRGTLCSVTVAATWALGLLPLALGLKLASEAQLGDPKRLLAAAALATPALGWTAVCAIWHDLGRAFIAASGKISFPALASMLRQSVRPVNVREWLLWSTAAWTSAAIASGLPMLPATSHLPGWALLLTAQGFALARTILRSRWLATAVATASMSRSTKGAE